ncbi:sigma-70 family RNA polymerase sigma factor [Winogradskyella echinorum]|uniref:Sigma-70 family RNA polymerase sigma factor n=1 Tax=Winogradskyella echinorum TaxID=538189 RepID=A0ABR6Y0B4_9FLAO|nr:sigma-70 family RNA polymerase sigma factor [Winogradskyella echinorum]MBC3846193.1 sigma-70 family RNA polymerase sigma factor [Winogradskyella echinorum]MBC5750541.1 sigma-70 family RNA polymerase sigma factor [Winogradskyella echinorum]
MENKLVDHLFRHHSGKMVSVLTRIFGLSNLDIIEDAVQDTFIKASISWRKQQPEHPEAWLTKAAKNRVIDIFRTLKAQKNNLPNITQGTDAIAINELFLDAEIEDAQLRMIFTACHPKLDPRDRISFALKTVSGFSTKEIASALLTKEETIKKRLMRARKAIQKSDIQFYIPQGKTLNERLESVMEVLYLIFNEGFHSNNKEHLIREDLCGEAMRLCKLLLKYKQTRSPECYALFALMCFHSARLPAKTSVDNEVLDLKQQNRALWHFPFIQLGNTMMSKAVETEDFSCYHFEAAIAAEHLKAKTFEDTNWNAILKWYQALHQLQPMPSHLLTMAVICIQNKDYETADFYFKQLQPEHLEQRAYLYFAAKADYFAETKNLKEALIYIDLALYSVTNSQEKAYLQNKKAALLQILN